MGVPKTIDNDLMQYRITRPAMARRQIHRRGDERNHPPCDGVRHELRHHRGDHSRNAGWLTAAAGWRAAKTAKA